LHFASYYNRPLILAALIEAAGPNAAALVRRTTNGQVDGWTPLHTASRAGHTECVRLLLSAGAGLDIDLLNLQNQTALDCAIAYGRRRLYPMLLAAGATIPPDADNIAHRYYYWVDESGAAYLRKVAAAGGFPAYEKAHRQALVALAAKAFPRLPTDVAGHVVAFAFHVGYY
jgi:ankyrin repeat protein